MSRTSYELLSAMPSEINFTGPVIPSAGWYGHTKGLHTIAICVHNFQGRISIQGSQAVSPCEYDWFSVPYPEPFTGMPYIQYPRPNIPHKDPNLRNGGENSTFGFSFTVNCLWLRASITRDYLLPINTPTYAGLQSNAVSWLGNVDSILVNY